MKLIVMRHGEAEATNITDKARKLTSFGRRQAKHAASWLSTQVFDNNKIDLALVSPFVRTQQTFECLKSVLTIPEKIDVELLTPNCKAGQTHHCIDEILAQHPDADSMIVVSHMPLVCYLVDELVTNQQSNLFDTSSMALIDYNRQTCSGELLAFYHPSSVKFELK